MADMPTSFWSGWIAVITLVSLTGLVWLLFSIYFSAEEQDSKHGDVVWDETLNEGEHPAPLWWFWLILSLLIFSSIYLILYPGLGAYRGVLNWSHDTRLEQSVARLEQDYKTIRQGILNTPLATLQQDHSVMTAARGIFNRNCTVCHGEQGKGQADSFPDLMNEEWQWGGDVAQLEKIIRNGTRAAMPAWGKILGEQGVSDVIQHLRSINRTNPATENDKGKTIFGQYCIACHGADGTGNPALGAPNLTDDVWLYGNTDAQLTTTIKQGRNGVMPSFKSRLDDTEVHMLLAWLTSR